MSLKDVLKDVGSLDDKVRVLNKDVENGTKKKANLEQDIVRLQEEKSELDKKVVYIKKDLAEKVTSAIAVAEQSIFDEKEDLKLRKKSVDEQRAKLVVETERCKKMSEEAQRATNKNTQGYEQIARVKQDVDAMKSKLIGVIKTIKDNLDE